MAGSYIVNVPKLKGRENYDEWAFAAENFLILEGVDINKKQPAASQTAHAAAAASTTIVDTDAQKAKAKLIMTIDSSLYVHIKNEKTVQDVWSRLKSLFDDSGFQRRISLLRHLISIRLEDCESMTFYVTQIVDTAHKLRGTGFQITDEWVGCLLLAGLTEKFAPMIMAIEHSGMTVSTDVIKSKLLDMSAEVGSTEGAFLSKSWQQRKKYNGGTAEMSKSKTSPSKPVNVTKKIRCYKCKQIGHYKNQCNYTGKDKESTVFSTFYMNSTYKKTDWYIDSGASSHMISDKECLSDITFNSSVKQIVVANQTTVPVLCSGNTKLTTLVDGSEFDITVKNVLCIPNLTTNLLSVSELIRNGNKVTFSEDICRIYNRNNVLVGKAQLINGVYKLNIKQESLFVGTAMQETSMLWHRRLGHINSKDLNSMKNGAVEGISYPDKAEIDKFQCVTCCEGKLARQPFSHKGTRSEDVLEMVHADVCGPMETVSIGMSRYFLLFVNDYSRMSFIYLLKSKSEVMKYFQEFKAMVEKQTGKCIKVLRTDNGGEFCGAEMESFMKKCGIIHQKTNPYTPEQNGMCERLNRTIVERARCLLFDANMEKKFWAEAVNTAVYLRNRTLASGLQKTPYELWSGRKPDLSHLRVFGSTAMAHVPKEKRLKWDKKAEKYILLGYAENTKGYRLYNPVTKRIVNSRDVVVMESSCEMTQAVVREKEPDVPEEEEQEQSLRDPNDSTYVPDSECTASSSSADEFYELENEAVQLGPVEQLSLGKRERKKPERYGFSNVCVTNEDILEESLTYEDVMNCSEQGTMVPSNGGGAAVIP
ncbi:hypothetical protein JYU34_006528 [Plutella xylostella]|uniref:Retrovirus-related Pol polyprotein from transposon TNT 1-94 n=1 Tax=Plutella xylostella TaxID=51655 RepID=A0ABQ7QS73_PLUXY|nr:hypothetical protein JYU34_006528 [Plutella xylostella]